MYIIQLHIIEGESMTNYFEFLLNKRNYLCSITNTFTSTQSLVFKLPERTWIWTTNNQRLKIICCFYKNGKANV